ncbi:MAG: DUF6713 family protein [Bacteroidota bacterium]
MIFDWYFLGLSLILLHELDAMRCHEWRMFPGLASLSEKNGMLAFLLLHIPLFYWVLTSSFSGSESFRMGFDYFLIIHLILHLLFLFHKKNEFKDWLSWGIIVGAAVAGGMDLLNY